jgi:hypothetical protein
MLLAFVSAVGICLSAGRAATAGREDAARKQVVLSGGCAWRTHYALFPPRLSAGAASAAGLATDEQSRTQYLVGDYQVPTKYRIVFGVAGRPFPNYVPGFSTPLPPENWAEPAFDDSGWLHAPGIEFTGMRASLVRPARGGWAHELPAPSRERMAAMRGTDPFVEEVGLICMRGRFLVKDRTRVKGLSLFLSYRGGFVAYLNGKEVARASLPAGPLTPTTAAADYPLDCFAGPGGEPPLDQWLSTDYDFDTLEPRWAARERRFGPRLIALAALRDGVNVLAVELHRSDYPAECRPSELGLCFGTVGVGELLLEAESPPENVVSATSRPDGLQVWNAEPWEVVYTTDYGNPAEPLQPIRLVGARNGAFSGQVVVGFTEPIADLRADVTPLDRAGGRGRIAADNLRVRFGRVNPTRGEYLLSWRTGSAGQRFDMLLDAPPAVVEPVAGGAPEAFLAPWAAVARQAAGLPARGPAPSCLCGSPSRYPGTRLPATTGAR